MADTNFRGPIGGMGALEVDAGTTSAPQPLDGPNYAYQGWTMLDPRNVPFPKDGTAPARVSGFMCNPNFILVDAIPQTFSTSVIAAAQAATALAAMALGTVGLTNFSASAGSIAVGVPLIPQGTTSVASVIALDFGFTTGTTIANSTVVNTPDNTLFQLGQWIIIGNVANAGATASLITQVIGIGANGTTLNVSPTPATAMGAPIGGANLFGSGLLPPAASFGPSAPTATALSKTFSAGLQRIHNPRENLARGLSITASASTSGTGTFLINGYDVWGASMTELLTASGTTTIYGKKAFKYIASVVPQDAGTTGVSASYSLGISDVFGVPMRVDEFQQLEVYAGNTAITNNVGVTTATTVAPTNRTSADVRGTIQISGIGGGTVITAPATSSNIARLYIVYNPLTYSLINTTPLNTVPLFGIAQSTT